MPSFVIMEYPQPYRMDGQLVIYAALDTDASFNPLLYDLVCNSSQVPDGPYTMVRGPWSAQLCGKTELQLALYSMP